jgi:hypothetical protein
MQKIVDALLFLDKFTPSGLDEIFHKKNIQIRGW